ncbi:alpha/beta-hydrolase [Colletotrichum somersetense]|nr:alpha/beta-hydrolase [Colletotrichum somersetense]
MSPPEAPREPLGIVLIHGGFHRPSCFDLAKARLEQSGFSPVVAVSHPSVGYNNKLTAEDDARNIQVELEPYFDQGKEFLAIAHSYGAVPVIIAAQGYSVAERASRGLKGGIRTIVFIAANVPPKAGESALSVLPPGVDIVDLADGLMSANAKAKAAFYGPDMADDMAEKCMADLLPQSLEALAGPTPLGADTLTVPAYYIICEKDRTVPPATQEHLASTIKSLKRVLRNPGGHSAFITEVDKFVEQIKEIAGEETTAA